MAIQIPELADQDNRWGRFTFVEKDVFPPDEWVSALLAVRSATTVGEQRDALARAVIFTAGSTYGLDPSSRANRYRPFLPASGIEAKVDIMEHTARLASIRVNGIQAGFHSPDRHPNPPYGVIDARDGELHHVLHSPDEALTDVGEVLGISAVRGLASFLESRNGRYNLAAELAAEGYPIATT